MPIRKTPLVSNEVYHVFNRSVALQPIFQPKRACMRMLGLLEYYKFLQNPIRYSKFTKLPVKERDGFLINLRKASNTFVEIYCFAIMPNHYHLLLKQKSDNGISKYIGNIQNSYARYLNTKTGRFGALFQSPFKAVRIETDYQFKHVARYIHLNPLTSYVISNTKELNSYPWNSFCDYVSNNPRLLLNTNELRSYFRSKNKLIMFTLNQLDYQRKLERIKHLAIDS